jgi:hypothetical protein
MRHQQQRGLAADEAIDECGPPQRPVSWQRPEYYRNHGVEQSSLVARRRTAQALQMAAEVEMAVVDPHRTTASRWRPGQPLPQPGDGIDPSGQHALGGRQVDRLRQNQHGSELLRHGTAIHGQERQIGIGRAIDRRSGGVRTSHITSVAPAGRRSQGWMAPLEPGPGGTVEGPDRYGPQAMR